MIGVIAGLIALLLAVPALAQVPPVGPLGLPLGPAVPGIIQPPTLTGTTSSVTSSPDVTTTGTLGALNDTVSVALSGHTGVGFLVAAGLNGTLVAEISPDSGTTWLSTYFINNKVWVGSIVLVGLSSGTGGTAMHTPPGTTHARVKVGAYTSGSAAVTVTATNAALAFPRPLIPGTSVRFGPDSGPGLSGSVSGEQFNLPATAPLRLGGTAFTLRTAGTLTPPVVTATQPPQVVMTFNGTIAGTTVTHYVLDAVYLRVLGAASVISPVMGRVVKRHVMYASTQTAAPAAGAVPTCANLAYATAGNAGGTFTYKYVAVDIWGYEGNLSAASANCTPPAVNGSTVTMAAVPAGAAGYNLYRTKTGPGATYYFVGRTNTTTFRDITADSALTVTQGTFGAWGTTPAIAAPGTALELVMEKFVALGTAPTIISTKTFPATLDNNRVVTIAPGTAVGRYRIPGEVESKAFLTTPTITTALARDADANYGMSSTSQINAAFGDIAINSFNVTDATMAGTFVVWGQEIVGLTEGINVTSYDGAAKTTAGFTEGSTLFMRWVASPVFSSGQEIAVEIGSAATAASTIVEVYVSGRYF